MPYSAEMASVTTWLMVGGGIIVLFSLVSCIHIFVGKRRTGLAKTIALIGFWISFYGAYMDPRLGTIW